MCIGVPMATDAVSQLADSLAKTQVVEGELSYKGQGRKLDNAQSGEYACTPYMLYLDISHTLIFTHMLIFS